MKVKPKRSRREYIIALIGDEVSRFIYYDRKEDEDLPRGAIEDAVMKGEISADEIVAKFSEALRAVLP